MWRHGSTIGFMFLIVIGWGYAGSRVAAQESDAVSDAGPSVGPDVEPATAGHGASGQRSRASQVVAGERTSPERAPRRRDASWREIFAGPFPSSRLFAMPTAEVVGAYQVSLSGDASSLNEADSLSFSSVVAVGYGDIAQLEYRSTSAITTLDPNPIRLPSLGVQLELPYRAPRYVPELALALRFGFPRSETSLDGSIEHDERTTDFYVVSRLPLGRLILHGGLRMSQAEIISEGESPPAALEEFLLLPTVGIEYRITDRALIAAEFARVPRFLPGDRSRPSAIDAGFFTRTGVRWRLLSWLVMDASVGYRIEVERVDAVDRGAQALIDWDMRLGGEIFIPWGAVLCRRAGLFCE